MLTLLLAGCTDGSPDSARDTAPNVEPLSLAVVLDISTSWSQVDFDGVRVGLAALLDVLVAREGPGDRVALVAFSGRYADGLSAWTELAGDDGVTAASWSRLNVASRSGVAQPFPAECQVSTSDAFGDGGCYPAMPRSYTDEAGTDHSVGLAMALDWITESPGEGAGAVVVVTDGVANGLSESNGQARAAEGYVETRWPEYVGAVPHSTADVEADSVALTAEILSTTGYSTWVVSVAQPAAYLDAMATGDGEHVDVEDAAGLAVALPSVVESY